MKHEEFVNMLAIQLKPAIYVELGIYHFNCFNKISPLVRGKAYAVDIADNRRLLVKHGHVDFHCCTTTEFYSTWSNEIKKEIDLIFIDADHSKDSVLQDVKNFLPWLREDIGVMVLHDTWPLNKKQTAPEYSGDCYLVPKILKEKLGNNIELFTLPTPYGLTLIRKPGDNWRNGHMDS